MKWSWKVATIAGIDLRIHATFLLIVGWIGFTYYLNEGTLQAALNGILFLLALFACVVLHELGHALAARKFGIPTRDITLLPIGGVARLERMPEKPAQELWVALAGPLVNVGISIALLAWLGITNLFQPENILNMLNSSFVGRLLSVNLFLALFNLIPAFPMDGGRVVRALLATRLEYSRATRIAATLGQAIAFIFGFVGLFTNPFLVFIALFVYIGAGQEASLVQAKSAMDGIPVADAMLTDFKTISADDSLSRAVSLLMSGSQQDFPVVADGRVVGVLTRQGLVSALQQYGEQASVSNGMVCEFRSVDAADMLEAVSRQLQDQDCHTLPVLRNGALVGLITMENIGEFLMIRSAMKKSTAKIQPLMG